MPLTAKGEKIRANFIKEYGEKKGEEYFYRSKNAGTITGVDSADTALPMAERTVDEDVPPPERSPDLAGNIPTEQGGYQMDTLRRADAGPPGEPQRTGDSIPVGDQSLRNMNERNRKFWGV